MNLKFHRLLLAATALAGAVPAHGQVSADVAAEIAALRAQIDALEAQVAEMRTASAAAPTPAAAEGPEIRFRGAPQITAPGGWSFKPRGRIQYDAGFVSSPDGISDPGLGFSNELRRGRLGVEGTIPGGFGYVFEMDFADNNVDITDAILTYKASDLITFTAGQHNNFQSLEELTSSRFSSFIERAAFTDAFNFERRVGLSGTLTSGELIVQGGVFTDNINDLTDDGNNAIGADARVVFAPRLGETQLHFGASGHWRNNRDLPEDGFTTRYRQRPLVHSTDVRFIATPTLSVENETHYGLEAAIIAGPFHAVGEVHWLDANPLGTGSDYSFFGGYAEVGYFITGESRGYRGGRFDRTSVERPVGDGGLGALQVNLRYDHVDLTSNVVVGGSQDGFQGSLIWIPTDYVRFMINYARLEYDDAALIAVDGDRDYAVDVLGARAQIDF